LLAPSFVVATGTDVGNEVLSNAAAALDLPMVANCLAVESTEPFTVRRVRWGGSLIEHAVVDAPVRLLTVAHHAVDAVASPTPVPAAVKPFEAKLDPTVARSAVVERVERDAGVTLSTAPVVVGGGRGVGSAEGFAALEELAALLGGVVGCSRAVTNNGWRNHTDQVGQTGTRIAPEIYIACGISGAIQHWVGAMASKRILAINTDAQANMVAKADYAVIGDLHQVVPAISAAVRRRRDHS
jgi:electron transfer flavoprotein alpha subunit